MTDSAKVLVVGIDGVRWDVLPRAATPFLDAVAERGFAAPVTVDAACPTISGPCWATILTGTLPATHGIVGNVARPATRPPPDALALARAAGRRTFAAASWPAFFTVDGPGPILADGGEREICGQAGIGTTIAAWDAADAEVARTTSARLGAIAHSAGGSSAASGGEIDLAFAYLGLADEIAHETGCGTDYLAAIETCDERLGTIVAGAGALDEDSEWTVLIVTDHGHIDAGGHGGDSDVERGAWVAACGPGIGPVPPARIEQVDVAAQVLTVLGAPLPAAETGFRGLPFGARG